MPRKRIRKPGGVGSQGMGMSYKPTRSSEHGFGVRTGNTFTRFADWKRVSVPTKSRSRRRSR